MSDETQGSNRSDRRDVKLTDGDDFTSLRDRIARVLIRDAFGMTTRTAAYRQADAVIAELGLSVTGGVIVGCLHD